MNNFLKPLIFIAIYLFVTGTTGAMPQSEFQLDRIEKTSDLIAVVQVCGTEKSGKEKVAISGNEYFCPSSISTCKILAVLKGNEISRELIKVICFDCSELLIPTDDLVSSEIAIVFLKKYSGDSFVLSDLQQSKIKLSYFVENNPITDRTLREKIGTLLISDIEKQTPEQILKTFQWVKNIKYDVSKSILNPLIEHTNTQIRAVVLESLVRANDGDVIQESVNLLSEDRSTTYELASLAWSLEVADISTEQANQLAVSKNSAISQAGMRILRTKADASSISFLVKELDNTNTEIQYNALVALYHIAREPGPSLNDFWLDPKLKIEECKSMLNRKVILKHSD